MITSIVAGFDGSDAATRALQMACALASKFDAMLEVSHTPAEETVHFAAEAISGFYVGPSAAHDELLVEVAQKMAERARKIAAEAGMSDVEVHIGHGDAARNVLERAEAAKADLIVTGRRGLGAVSGLFLGSTSQNISKGAQCAVLTVV